VDWNFRDLRDPGENAETTGIRELREEARLAVSELVPLIECDADFARLCNRLFGYFALVDHVAETENGIILNVELVGPAGLPLAHSFSLGRVEGMELPSALALLLRADLLGTRERPFERGLELGLVGDLAADVADEAAEPRA
jgi:8-oxo-dGTP pyrophosphatase MutT (NUDIX family)